MWRAERQGVGVARVAAAVELIVQLAVEAGRQLVFARARQMLLCRIVRVVLIEVLVPLELLAHSKRSLGRVELELVERRRLGGSPDGTLARERLAHAAPELTSVQTLVDLLLAQLAEALGSLLVYEIRVVGTPVRHLAGLQHRRALALLLFLQSR